jgi:hypothetical protein
MKKTSLTRALLVAGTLAVAGLGAAQADAIFYPDGTMVDLGPTGADQLALSSGGVMAMSSADTTVLGAGPATAVTTVTTQQPVELVYVQPNIDWDRSSAIAQMHHNAHLMHRHGFNRTGATASFNVPARAGEASTMTAGVPNAVTSNERVVVGSYTIPADYVSGNPYYVFSY